MISFGWEEEGFNADKFYEAFVIVNNWRSCHNYPINTFQALLRKRLSQGAESYLVAQRLKRMPSIVKKLRLHDTMKLSRMQDIGGLRAVVPDLKAVRELADSYRQSKRLTHELVLDRDYIQSPKSSGYRSAHLVYRYKNVRRPEYDGLLIELQLRTKLQHVWATAVETVGTFLNYSLKSSEGPGAWLDFFALVGAGFACLERTAVHEDYADLSSRQIYQRISEQANDMRVRESLVGFSVAADRVQRSKTPGSLHLIVLDPIRLSVDVTTFSRDQVVEASRAYAEAEGRITEGERIQTVLVSAGRFEDLRRAYPNYFLDTGEFLSVLDRMEVYSRR